MKAKYLHNHIYIMDYKYITGHDGYNMEPYLGHCYELMGEM